MEGKFRTAALIVIGVAILLIIGIAAIRDAVEQSKGPEIEIFAPDIQTTEVQAGPDRAVIERATDLFLDVDGDQDKDYVIEMIFIRDDQDDPAPIEEPVAQEPAPGPTATP